NLTGNDDEMTDEFEIDLDAQVSAGVLLGFVEPLPADDSATGSEDLVFSNRVGGVPAWLDPSNPLTAEDVCCETCGVSMSLLLQMYAPEDEPEDAYHRVIYVFACRNGECHRKYWRGCFKVFRAQLAEQNDIYEYQPQNQHQQDENGTALAMTCVVCNLAAPHQCSNCKSARYCSQAHQAMHWKAGDHSVFCKAILSGKMQPIQQSSTTAPSSSSSSSSKLVSKSGIIEVDDDGNEVDDNEETDTGVDPAFIRFHKRVLRAPSQVLRYTRTADDPVDATTPLWVSEKGKPSQDDIPACELCGGERELEMQIMPQLLDKIGIDHKGIDSIDWGTLLIYTCANSCSLNGLDLKKRYAEEVLFRQQFSSESIVDRIRETIEGNRNKLKPEDYESDDDAN
ncbi:hypothetical protein GQ42DRAFT_125405, partial [Ramicandelaber brevisporus]